MGTMGDNKNANLLRNPYLQGLRNSVGNRNDPGKCFPRFSNLKQLHGSLKLVGCSVRACVIHVRERPLNILAFLEILRLVLHL